MSHTRRRLLWLFVAVLLVAAGLIAWNACRPADSLEAKYGRVRVGMSKQEVESILGPPTAELGFGQEIDFWWDGGRSIDVRYSSAGIVEAKKKSWETGWEKFRKKVISYSPF
jgi:hypothetical protein